MTMSHLLRRTKKCCLKLFRKLSINTDQPSSNNNRLSNSRTTKYFKHKTKTSTSSSSSMTTTTKRRKITSSSPKFKSKKLKSYIKEETSSTTIDEFDDDVAADTNRNKVRKNENKQINNNNRTSSKCSQTYRNTRRPSRVLEYKHRNCCNNGGGGGGNGKHDTNNNDKNSFFRFNKDYLKNYFNFYKLSQNNKMMTNSLSECRDKNQLNNDFYLHKMFEDDSIRFTDNKIYIDKNSLKSCCSKIQFNNHNTINNNNNNNNKQIIFEKVIYDKNKKYLSHSPTLSAVPSPTHSFYDNLNIDNLFNNYPNNFFIFDNENKSILSLYENHQYDENRSDSYDPWLSTTNTKIPQTSAFSEPSCASNSCTTLTSRSSLSDSSFDNDDDGYRNRNDIKGECSTLDPWSAFDVNTLDLKTKSTSMKLSRSENKPAHRNNNNNNNNKVEGNSSFYTSARNNLHNWCNQKISSSTLETWIDDEVFDNSFNEELEKRCAIFEK